MVVEDGTADDDDNDERMTEEREVALDGGGKFKEELAPLHPRRTSQRASHPASQPERDWLRNYYAKNFVKDTPKTCPIPTFHASQPDHLDSCATPSSERASTRQEDEGGLE